MWTLLNSIISRFRQWIYPSPHTQTQIRYALQAEALARHQKFCEKEQKRHMKIWKRHPIKPRGK